MPRMLPNSGKYHWPKDIKVTDGYAYSTVLNQYITPTTFLCLLFAAHTHQTTTPITFPNSTTSILHSTMKASRSGNAVVHF